MKIENLTKEELEYAIKYFYKEIVEKRKKLYFTKIKKGVKFDEIKNAERKVKSFEIAKRLMESFLFSCDFEEKNSKEPKIPKVIAVDFDGTLFENDWPNIGNPKYDVINKIKEEKKKGSKIILWTCREGDSLEEALKACKEVGIEFDAVNDSIKEWKDSFGYSPRKIGASEYWDDKAVKIY